LPIAPGAYQLRVVVVPEIQADDIDHEFHDALAVADVPFSLVGDATRRPGLLLDVHWAIDREPVAGPGRRQTEEQPLS